MAGSAKQAIEQDKRDMLAAGADAGTEGVHEFKRQRQALADQKVAAIRAQQRDQEQIADMGGRTLFADTIAQPIGARSSYLRSAQKIFTRDMARGQAALSNYMDAAGAAEGTIKAEAARALADSIQSFARSRELAAAGGGGGSRGGGGGGGGGGAPDGEFFKNDEDASKAIKSLAVERRRRAIEKAAGRVERRSGQASRTEGQVSRSKVREASVGGTDVDQERNFRAALNTQRIAAERSPRGGRAYRPSSDASQQLSDARARAGSYWTDLAAQEAGAEAERRSAEQRRLAALDTLRRTVGVFDRTKNRPIFDFGMQVARNRFGGQAGAALAEAGLATAEDWNSLQNRLDEQNRAVAPSVDELAIRHAMQPEEISEVLQIELPKVEEGTAPRIVQVPVPAVGEVDPETRVDSAGNSVLKGADGRYYVEKLEEVDGERQGTGEIETVDSVEAAEVETLAERGRRLAREAATNGEAWDDFATQTARTLFSAVSLTPEQIAVLLDYLFPIYRLGLSASQEPEAARDATGVG